MKLLEGTNEYFDIALSLIINYDMGFIDCCVTLLNKTNNKKQMRCFSADRFDEALKYYHQQLAMFIET